VRLVPAFAVDRRRSFSKFDRTRVFLRDGFLDRYSGDRLFFPPVLEVISASIPEDFPLHPSTKMSNSHVAHWELYASVDHVVPVARSGTHEIDNWVTTSFMHNLIKSHWSVEFRIQGRTGESADLAPVGPRLCRILQPTFREDTFHVLR